MRTIKGWIEVVYREHGPWAALAVGVAAAGVLLLIMRLAGVDLGQAVQVLGGLLQ
jgi:hypothetical protein